MHTVYLTYSGRNCEAVLQVMETLVRNGYALMCECMLTYDGDPEAQAHRFIRDADAVVAEIRKYKVLLDEGILTEEEFTLKKKQLLGI